MSDVAERESASSTGSDLEKRYPTLMKYSSPLKAAERKIVGRENEIAQLMAALSRPELCNAILLAPAGSGKLLPLDTPVPTPTGWTTMGELEIGDYVLGQDGRPAPVIFTSEIEQAPELYELTFSDGRTETACADHQWLVSDENQRDRRTPSGHKEIADRLQANAARRDGYLRLAEAASETEHVTVHELLVLIEDVPGVTWTTPFSLSVYLREAGVPARKAERVEAQGWKGGTRTTTLHVAELHLKSALEVLANQGRRQFSQIGDESVLTTKQMIDRGIKGAGGGSRFAIRVAAPLELPAQDLVVDPYVLGAWLGDGHTHKQISASITSADQEIIDEVLAAGYVLRRIEEHSGVNASRKHVFDGLGADLTAAGVGDAKRIPMQYLRASFEQRLALLQGIMDTDGSISESGGCELTLSDADLAADVEELIHTLGIKVSRRVGTAGYRGESGEFVQCKDRHRMTFTTSLPVFRMVRKAIRVPAEVRSTQGYLYITDIKPVESRPGKCIQVGNADSMYLCGRGFVPTHNTALVQGTMLADPARSYREVDLARMIADLSNVDEMAARLKTLFDEAEAYREDQGHDLVLFIDEFHQVVQLSPASVEALKPILAASGARGIRVIAATTFDEFRQHISANQPLVERLQRINLAEPDRKTTIEILRGMAERYKVGDQFYDDHMFEMIYEFTNRYIPMSSQPRKSILVLDSMVGWHRYTGRPIDKRLLADVLYESQGVNIAFRVDAVKIKDQLDRKVFAQDLATSVLARRLQLCVADLNDKTKPMSSFLFTGSTGVGKTELTKQLAHLLFGDATRHLIRFDMTEYSQPESVERFRDELTNKVWERAYSVILFDEIEKAASTVTRVLLQVLDDGRMSDRNNRQVSFLNAYIVLTTNAGSEIFETIGQYASSDDGSGQEIKRYEKLIRRSISTTTGDNRFPPELLGRIDAIVPFQPLSRSTQESIIMSKLGALRTELLTKHDVKLAVDKKVVQYLVEDQGETSASAGGARAAIAKLNEEVITEVAAFVNANPRERSIKVNIMGELVSDNKQMLESDAHVVVTAHEV